MYNDTQRAIAYAESELGNYVLVNEAAVTYTVKRAVDYGVVLAAGTSHATVKTHAQAVHPAISRMP